MAEINGLHENLTFTFETEDDDRNLSFLDTRLQHKQHIISSSWYSKPTDTVLILNFHSLAPTKYKRNIVQGMIHRVYNACSDWNIFDESLRKTRMILEQNQYPQDLLMPSYTKPLKRYIPVRIRRRMGN